MVEVKVSVRVGNRMTMMVGVRVMMSMSVGSCGQCEGGSLESWSPGSR